MQWMSVNRFIVGLVLMLAGPMLWAQVEEKAEEQPDGEAADSAAIVMSSGIEGGGYWGAATRLQSVATGMGFDVEVVASEGSLHNLRRLLDPEDPVNLVLAQADALQYHLKQNPDAATGIEILENIGQECVYILTGSDSAIRTDMDLHANKNYRIGISSPESGIAVTYDYMKSLTPELANTKVVYTDTAAAMLSLNDADNRPVDAVMLVHRPRAYSPEVSLALENLSRYRFVKIRDPRLNEELPNGETVYQPLDLAMPRIGSEGRFVVKTICVKGLLVSNKGKLPSEQRDQLADLVSYHWIKVFSTE
jgi:TRAP-type uncharacterized transport system substrate-binding protein